jgi:hypothetical protein
MGNNASSEGHAPWEPYSYACEPRLDEPLYHDELVYFFTTYGGRSRWRATLTTKPIERKWCDDTVVFVVMLYEVGAAPRQVASSPGLKICRMLLNDARNEITKQSRDAQTAEHKNAIRTSVQSGGGTSITSTYIDTWMKRIKQKHARCVNINIGICLEYGRLFQVIVASKEQYIRADDSTTSIKWEQVVAMHAFLCKELFDDAETHIDEWFAALVRRDASVALRKLRVNATVPDALSAFMLKYAGKERWRAEVVAECAHDGDDAENGFAIYVCDSVAVAEQRHRVAWNAQLCTQLLADAERGICALL